jgi:hypothetical protein
MMKSGFLFLSSIVVSGLANLSFAAPVQRILLARNGQAFASIRLTTTESSTDTYAASELTDYLCQITGTSFSVTKQTTARLQIILKRNQNYGKEDYSVGLEQKDILLQGGSSRAILYAVYSFLGQLGCCWISPQFSYYNGHSEWIPKVPVLYYNFTKKIYEHPQFGIRKVDIEEGRSHTVESLKQLIEWMPKVRLNTFMVPLNYQGAGKVQWDKWREELVPELKKRDLLIEVGGHGYQNFLNAHMEGGTLFTKHQDWFGKNKKGEPDTALNLVFNTSNQEAVDYFIGNILHYLKEHPEIDIFDLWPPDVARWAETSSFTSFGIPSDQQAMLVNTVDSAIKKLRPRLRLEIIAYGQVLQPPKNVSLNNDILADICPIDQSFERPLFDTSHTNNKEYVKAISNWKKNFSGGLGLYSYYRKYAWRSLPVVIPHFIQQELQWYKQHRFMAISSYAEPGDWYTYELNHYTLAALAWDPSVSVDSLMRQYCSFRYPGNTGLAYETYLTMENIVPRLSSIPFTTLKNQEEYIKAIANLQNLQQRMNRAIQQTSSPENIQRLQLMIQYALYDITLVAARVNGGSNINTMVQTLADFLNDNIGAGVFLPYSINALQRTYNSK